MRRREGFSRRPQARVVVALEGGAGEGPGGAGVVLVGFGAEGELEGAGDAGAHFAGGFAGEGDGDDGFGVIDGGEEGEEALGEEFGFAGAGGGLDEEGLVDVEGAGADGGVGGWHGGRYLFTMDRLAENLN